MQKKSWIQNTYYKVALGFLICSSIICQSQAASRNETMKTKTSNLSSSKISSSAKNESAFSGSLSAAYSELLVRRDEASQYKVGSLAAGLNYKLNTTWATSLKTAYSKDFRDEKDFADEISDLGIGLSYLGLPKLSFAKQSIATAATVPLSKQSRYREDLNGALGFRYSWSNLPRQNGLSWSVYLGLAKLFHSYETDRAGGVLTSYSIKEGLEFSYSFGRFSISTEAVHSHRISYQNAVTQIISHSEEMEFEILPSKWSLAIGHSNEGPWFKQASEELNLEAVNDDSSIIYINSKVSF